MCRRGDRKRGSMYHCNPVSLSSNSLSYLTAKTEYSACTKFCPCSCFCCGYYSYGCCYCWLPHLSGHCYQKKIGAQVLTKDVLEHLECPVCMQYMLPPNTLCRNGHNICSICKQKFRNVQPADIQFQIHEIRHWRDCMCVLSVLAPINHTDTHSLFRSPSYVSMKMYASLVHSTAL